MNNVIHIIVFFNTLGKTQWLFLSTISVPRSELKFSIGGLLHVTFVFNDSRIIRKRNP